MAQEAPSTTPATTAAKTLFTGHCFCNAIEYTLSSPPLKVYICHCLDCRYFSGTSFACNALFISIALKILKPQKDEVNEALNIFGDKKAGYRQFCAKCGSPLFMTTGENVDGMHGKLIVTVGTIVGTEKDQRLKPTAEGWCKWREGWLQPAKGANESEEW